ncbi:MAG: hypothetical protein V4699_02510 [Patescibacteria group bacterium]
MRKIIHNLRNQPEQVKMHILHVATIVAGIILILLWIYSLGTNLSNPNTQAKVSNDLKPFSVLKDNIISGYQSISGTNTDTEQ